MDKSFAENYPTFTYNNQSVILRPGNQFTKNELRSRLHQMDVDSIGIDSRAQLINLYESTLRDDRNKFKLFDRLRDDTNTYASKMGISLNKKMPISTNNEIHNQERSKVINLKYAAQNETPYDENDYEENNNRSQNIKLRKPRNQNKNNNVNPRNAFFLNEKNEQNDNNTYVEEENNNINYNNSYQENNKNSRNFSNNEIGYNDLNNTNNYMNNYKNNNVNQNEKRNINNNINNNNYDYYENQNNNQKMFTNEPQEDYNNKYQEPLYPKNNVRNSNNINDMEESDTKKIRAPDEESSFSFFSSFSTFKNTKQICFHVLTGFIVICLALGILYLYRIFSEQINGFFSQVFDAITHPGEIISTSFEFLRNYWYIIPIILICVIIIISLIKRYKIKKRCEEILKKIVDDLSKDEENGRISEEDIYRRYVQELGVSWNKFKKNYLPNLDDMRKKREKRLKKSSEKINGNVVVFWEYFD
jgi:hypothetical protein